MIAVQAIEDIVSRAKGALKYASKGDVFKGKFYCLNNFGDELYLCENKGVKFITNKSNLRIIDSELQK